MKPTDNHLDGVIIEFLCKGVPASGMSLSLCAVFDIPSSVLAQMRGNCLHLPRMARFKY